MTPSLRLTPIAKVAEILAASRQPDVLGPFGVQKYVAIDLRAATAQEMADCEALSPRIAQLPCPLIGLMANLDPPSTELKCFDVLVDTISDLNRIVATIEGTPIAAMVLVQTLRTTEHLSMDDALAVESMAYGTLQKGQEFLRWLEHRNTEAGEIRRIDDRSAAYPVQCTRHDGHLSVVLNRPEHRNAINTAMRDALVEMFDLTAEDRSITEVTVSGEGRCFSIGGDLDEFGSVSDAATAHAIRSVRLPARALLQCRDRVHFYLHGACIGAGIEMSAFGANIAATKKTFIQLPELQFGLIPGAGGCVSLPRRIGRQRTAYLTLTGKRVRAQEALKWGLIDEIVN